MDITNNIHETIDYLSLKQIHGDLAAKTSRRCPPAAVARCHWLGPASVVKSENDIL